MSGISSYIFTNSLYLQPALTIIAFHCQPLGSTTGHAGQDCCTMATLIEVGESRQDAARLLYTPKANQSGFWIKRLFQFTLLITTHSMDIITTTQKSKNKSLNSMLYNRFVSNKMCYNEGKEMVQRENMKTILSLKQQLLY